MYKDCAQHDFDKYSRSRIWLPSDILEHLSVISPEIIEFPLGSYEFSEASKIDEEDLVFLPTKSLNALIRMKGLSEEDAREIKRRRRILKNRGYAAICRSRREVEKRERERYIAEFKYKIEEQKAQVSELDEHLQSIRTKIGRLIEGLSSDCKKKIAREILEDINPDPQVLSDLTSLLTTKVGNLDS